MTTATQDLDGVLATRVSISAPAAANRPAQPRRNTALRPASAEPARIAEVA